MNLLIIGAGGHGQVIYDTAKLLNKYNTISFLDDQSELAIDKVSNYHLYKNKYEDVFIAIGNSQVREELMNKLKDMYNVVSIIHPSASIAASTKIGTGTYIAANVVVNSNSIIGKGCILGIGSLVDHNAIVEDYSYVNIGSIVRVNEKVKRHELIDMFIK